MVKAEFYPPSCWFFLNSSQMVNAVTLAALSNFSLERFLPNLVSITWTSLQILRNFWSISIINEKCHNSRTSNYTGMKLGPVTKLNKINMALSKQFDNDVILVNCEVTVIFTIYGQLGAIRKPHPWHMFCKNLHFN